MSRVHIWVSRNDRRAPDPQRCRLAVHDGGRWPGFHQCTRKAVVFRDIKDPEGLFGFCKQHDPIAVELRDAARQREWGDKCRQQQEAFQLNRDIETAKDRCVAALREIEQGHNDPRALARATLRTLDVLRENKNANACKDA